MMIKYSKHLVGFTGEGISTSCGIPDFRGPKGVWPLQRDGKGVPEASLPFDRAMPSLTHMALVELEKAGVLSILLARYVRDFEVETIGMQQTSRRCSDEKCGSKLRDIVLDWEDALPPKEMSPADKHCRMVDLILCVGTSLQITPACNLPYRSIRNGGKDVIVNLQPTPKDKKASLVIHGLVDKDKVISGVMHLLKMLIPPSVRFDLLQIFLKQVVSKHKERCREQGQSKCRQSFILEMVVGAVPLLLTSLSTLS